MSSIRTPEIYDNLTKYTTDRDFYLDIALGRVRGMDLTLITGYSSNISVADGEVSLFDFPAHRMKFPTGAVDVWISSSNVADNMRVLVIGLTSDLTPVIIITNLNGQTPANINQQMRHVQSVRVLDQTPLGDVYVSRTNLAVSGVPIDPDDLLSFVKQGVNTSRHGFFMIPKGVSGVTLAIRGNTDAESKPATITTNIILLGDIPLQTVAYSVSPAFAQFLFPTPIASSSAFGQVTRILPEGTLVEFTAKASANNTSVFFGLDMLLVDNDLFAGQTLT